MANRGRPRSRSRGRSVSKSRSANKTKTSSPPVKPETIRKSRSLSASRKKVSTDSAFKSHDDPDTPIRASLRLQEKIRKQLEEEVTMVRNRLKTNGNSSTTPPAKQEVTSQHDVIGFGGAVGGAALSVLLPALVYAIVIACDKRNGCVITRLPAFSVDMKDYFDVKVFGVVLSWYLLQVLLALLPVGPQVMGQPLKGGKRLLYRCNGFLALLISVLIFAVALHQGAPMDFIHKHWLQFVTASIVYSFVLAVGLYIHALYVPDSELAPEATGSLFNDFFMGRELNPRVGSLDLKFMCELRPGLIGWMLVDWSLCASQYQQSGAVSPALALVTLFQTIYVFDALKHESSILTTMDIITEGFGFMLAFGDLAWVPALYTLQAHFIYNFPELAVSNVYGLVAIGIVKAAGYIIFRGANSQKDVFRNNPNDSSVAHLATIPTSAGKKLLCAGYWGICRRPNYLGDILMATAWSLTCGTTHLLPYFYPIYFFILLVHRQIRDEAYCKQKYGAAWDSYCKKVPYRIIPYVF